jgi:hypothetical protein
MMKKYWKTVFLLTIMVISISGFYIHSAYSASQLPEFVITKQEGDTKEINPVTINGGYSAGTNGEQVEITAKGSEYESERSFFKNLENFSTENIRIKALQKKYSSFMRGFTRYGEDSFFENSSTLAFAAVRSNYSGNILDSTFQIGELNNKTKEKNLFSLPVPENKRYSYIWVDDVQYDGSDLQVITKNGLQNDAGQEIHLYTLDTKKERIVSDKTLISETNSTIDFSKMNQVDNMAKNHYIVYKKVPIEQGMDDSGTEEKVSKTEYGLFVYNLKEQVEIQMNDLPKELLGALSNEGNSYDGSNIYFVNGTEGKVTVSMYNFEENKPLDNLSIPLGGNDYFFKQTSIQKDKIYILATKPSEKIGKEQNYLLITSLHTGGMLYKGKIEMKDSDKKISGTLDFYQINLN